MAGGFAGAPVGFGTAPPAYRAPPQPMHSPTLGPRERVVKWMFDLATRTWRREEMVVRIDSVAFSRGSMRTCFHMQDCSPSVSPAGAQLVAKISNDPNDSANVYRQDVEMQAQCEAFALLYNRTRPPKEVHFAKAFLIECVQRPDQRLYFVEPLLHGTYRKYSNNYGYVHGGELARNTPQAFSHFTYTVSGGLLLVCDIQGVDDMYTDPQIHTTDAKIGSRSNRFGKGNVGIKGIRRFFETHRCNNLCHYLELPPPPISARPATTPAIVAPPGAAAAARRDPRDGRPAPPAVYGAAVAPGIGFA